MPLSGTHWLGPAPVPERSTQENPCGQSAAALQWTAYSFDAAVWELFWPLVVGARAVVAPAKIHLDLERFVDLIADNGVATLHFVPAMLQTFLSAPRVERCVSLRHAA